MMPPKPLDRFAARRSAARATLALAAALTVLLPSPASAASPAARLYQLTNQARASSGRSALALDPGLNAIAQGQAAEMARRQSLFHSSTAAARALPWSAWAENVGTGADADSVHRALMASAQHRANILEARFNLVGIGVAIAGGKIWVAEEFVARSGARSVPAPAPVIRRASPQTPQPPPLPPPPPPPPAARATPVQPFEPYLGFFCEETSLGCVALMTLDIILSAPATG